MVLLQAATSQSMQRPWFLTPFPNKRNQNPVEIELILEQGQEIYKVIPEHLKVPEGKKYSKL